MIQIRDHELPVDVLEELSPYDWYKGRPRVNEFTACSPFRRDGSPSWSISLETGKWIDFGAGEEEFYKKGNLITLLSFLRAQTPGEVEEYLLDKYGIDLSDVDGLELGLNFTEEEAMPFFMSLEEYRQYAFRHPYLAGRGISEKVQGAFKIGYDKVRKAVAIPWQDKDGNIINIKFRSVHSKLFFYLSNGQKIRDHIYGMNFIYKYKKDTVYIVESEIDCLYLWSNGYAAVSLGGSNLSAAQVQGLLCSPIRHLIIATDNDSAGEKVKGKLIKELNGSLNLSTITFPDNVKDVNDLSPDALKTVLDSYTPVDLFQLLPS